MQKINKRFWLEKFDCFTVSGADSKKFINGLTTGNIINSENKVLKTCLLTPNGVLRSLLEIIFLDESLEVVILEGDINEIINFFDKIIFPADNVLLGNPYSISRFQEIDDINSWRIYKPIFFRNEDKGYEIYKNKSNLLNDEELKLWKINQAIPTFNNELNTNINPLELGLTDLIDFKKGCFLGQETISKIKNVSSLKQEIRVWNSLESAWNWDSQNRNLYINSSKQNSVGKITSFISLDSQVKGLAMIKRKYLEIENYLYSEIFGKIKIKKSIGSKFL